MINPILDWSEISIHSLRKEGDGIQTAPASASSFISIHSLRKERDTIATATAPALRKFQSTPSARRETGTA